MKYALLTGAILFAGPLLADATTDMCLEMSNMSDAQCACATEALAGSAGEDATLYESVGTLYLGNKSAGQSMVDAWDVAIAETAEQAGLGRTELLSRMNDVGRAHRDAIKGCK